MNIKKFKDFGIKQSTNCLSGDKIKMSKILNKEIIVTGFKIEQSKYPEKGNGKCLYIEILHNGNPHVVFTGSVGLQEAIQKIRKEDFPFSTTIIQENERNEFT